MSETRRPDYILSLKNNRSIKRKIEIFKKSQWTENVADEVYYRLRIDSVWYGGGHREMTFLDKEGVMALVKRSLAEGGVA